MKILLSAFACVPAAGSEGGGGWRWAIELAKHHEVVVITDVTRRAAIEAELVKHPVVNLQFIYFRPTWLTRVPLNSSTAPLLYTAWQFGLLPFAKSLHKRQSFNLIIHISYGVFRHPSFMGWLGVPFVFGPLGGGEDAPFRLKHSIKGREKIKEVLRTLVNKVALIDPLLWIAYAKATWILVRTEDTRNALPWPFRKRAIVYQEIGIDVKAGCTPATRLDGEPLRVLYAGRLLGLKGIHFAIRAMAILWREGVPCEFTLVGRGPYESVLRQLARNEGVEERIRWISYLPQQELFTLYGEMHCLLFPSLHDSGGNVVIEAQANGVPVICLDLGGPATLVTPDTSIVVATCGLNEAGVVQELAKALRKLAGDEEKRIEMACAGITHAESSMSWKSRVSGVLTLIEETRRGN